MTRSPERLTKLPLPVCRALRKLGGDIRDARLRRRIATKIMAERASISRTTLNKVEKGDPDVSLHSGGPFLAADDATPIPPLIHLRNHGFLYDGLDGWRLASAYDLNPVPIDIKPRVLATAIDLDDTTASLSLAMSVAAYFELEKAEAQHIAHAVGEIVSGWRKEAARVGLASGQINRMATAFEHDDLRAALNLYCDR